MTQPIKGSRVLGVDPGYRNGTKCAALDETGKYLGFFKIFQEIEEEKIYLIGMMSVFYLVEIDKVI